MRTAFDAGRRDRLIIRFTAIFCALTLLMFALELLPVHGEEAVYGNTIRLHVIANSDTDEDQALKLKVRDAVLACISEKTGGSSDFNEAYGVISASRGEIRRAALDVIGENGYMYDVCVELGLEDYPTRGYDEVRLPAGRYTSLRVKIGEAAGHNWWCVLFPALCTESASAREKLTAAGFTPSQIRILTENGGKYEVRFRILELIEKLFGRGL